MNAAHRSFAEARRACARCAGATHSTLWPNKCSKTKHCISKSTSGSSTILRPSKMPVRGGSRSRYSIAKPYFTIRDVAFSHRSTERLRRHASHQSMPNEAQCPAIVGAARIVAGSTTPDREQFRHSWRAPTETTKRLSRAAPGASSASHA